MAFMSETLYPRNLMLSRMSTTSGDAVTMDIGKLGRRRSNATDVNLKRTKELPFINFKPVLECGIQSHGTLLFVSS
jgi:hypothetical protein